MNINKIKLEQANANWKDCMEEFQAINSFSEDYYEEIFLPESSAEDHNNKLNAYYTLKNSSMYNSALLSTEHSIISEVDSFLVNNPQPINEHTIDLIDLIVTDGINAAKIANTLPPHTPYDLYDVVLIENSIEILINPKSEFYNE